MVHSASNPNFEEEAVEEKTTSRSGWICRSSAHTKWITPTRNPSFEEEAAKEKSTGENHRICAIVRRAVLVDPCCQPAQPRAHHRSAAPSCRSDLREQILSARLDLFLVAQISIICFFFFLGG
ncbi:Uncharacterized protein Fot_31088 [Forsythia ovata]|uniref:Uncharacterized protein n=1 Tax=Forsythia ovata TaxID=205694 RepID=A0ABD1T400_9LAMI